MEQMRCCGALAFTITVQEETVFGASGAPGSFWKLLGDSGFHSRAGIGAVVLLAARDERRRGTKDTALDSPHHRGDCQGRCPGWDLLVYTAANGN